MVEEKEQRGILQDLIMSVFEPGVNRGLLLVMHASFIGLLFSLLFLMVLTEGKNIHVWLLLFITVLLYGTIVWFVSELSAALEIQKKLEEKVEPSVDHHDISPPPDAQEALERKQQ